MRDESSRSTDLLTTTEIDQKLKVEILLRMCHEKRIRDFLKKIVKIAGSGDDAEAMKEDLDKLIKEIREYVQNACGSNEGSKSTKCNCKCA